MHTEAPSLDKRTSLMRLVAVGLVSVAASISAMAQAANPPPAASSTSPGEEPKKEELVVMNEFNVQASYAGSLEMAAQEKQDASAIVEVIAPEDLGVLPDVSIADSLARLTGLSSQRVNGRDQDITIRGMGPDFNVG